MKKLPFFILIILISFQCKNAKPSENQATVDSNKIEQAVSGPAPVVQQPQVEPTAPTSPKTFSDTAVIITDTTTIEIGPVKKYGVDEDADKQYLSRCKKWNLDSATIDKLLRNMEPLDGIGWDLAYSHLDCKLYSKVKISGKSYLLEINAGSWLELTTKDTTYLFIPKDRSFDKYFILHVGE
ncbi:hypothetical protein [Chitinophaga silvisoli]|uniref:Uncharacterized protein n=1 Tax=Chitinophaga silvisoli TaxID=2291814 RepID=A0A3E1P3H8_9BACT|nr:hypothetical protein [Chitinophaga silvisoli]RFM34664.1 hypothetical protein DXN04_15475 [Chitinophaga silvisoli]